jgi:hypothetical protein
MEVLSRLKNQVMYFLLTPKSFKTCIESSLAATGTACRVLDSIVSTLVPQSLEKSSATSIHRSNDWLFTFALSLASSGSFLIFLFGFQTMSFFAHSL